VTIRLSDILDDLREDHRNMTVLLDLLGRETDRIRDGEAPDYELVHDIMRYMTVYSDAVHHPKENVLYAAMRREDPDLARGLQRVGPEHEELAGLGEALRNDVEAIVSGAPVTRDKLLADATDYVRHLREHMAWEEKDLFQRADELVKLEGTLFVDISHLERLDPVFGPEREHSFANLLQAIRDVPAA
jgi:hemerythrin-like domain-containing protein